jgi:ABC-type uncharacterized transport system involved in gliding motility auxiliary subunit
MTDPIPPAPAETTGRRKAVISLHTGAAVLLAAALLGMVNYLSARHYARRDLSRGQLYTLSDKTRSLLASLTNTVQVTTFLTRDGSDIYDDVDRLLREYEYASDRVRVDRVNPHRDIARTKELAARYGVDELNVVVFDYNGRTRFVRSSEIMDMEFSGRPGAGETSKSSFKGEQAFSGAIQSITQERKPVVYFLAGHGERDINDFDPYRGFSEVAKEMRRDHIDVQTLRLGDSRALPDPCDALIIAGPQKRFAQPELDLLTRYLQSDGRLLLLLDAATRTGLEALLEEWGIRVVDDVVIDLGRTLTGQELLVTEYGPHAITRPLRNYISIFYLPRSVTPIESPDPAAGQADRPRVTVLASSTAAGWAESQPEQSPLRFDPDSDRSGPIPVAVAVERGAGQAMDIQIRPVRMVVFGDSDFVSNASLAGGNLDFFLGALNWLLEREELMAIAPKPVEQVRLVMTDRQLALLFWIVVIGLPVGVAGIGLIVWVRRRK